MDDDFISRAAPAAESVFARSARYGLNYSLIIRTRSRLRTGAVIILALAVVFVSGGFIAATSLEYSALIGATTFLIAMVAAAGAQVVAMLVTIAIANLFLRHASVLAQETAAAAIAVLTTALGLSFAVQIIPSDASAQLGAVIGSLVGGFISLGGVMSLPSLLKSDSPAAPHAIAHYVALPPWLTLTGGTTRYILIDMTLRMIADVGTVFVLFTTPVAVIPLTVFGMGTTLAAAYFISRNRPRAMLTVTAAFATVTVIAAMIA